MHEPGISVMQKSTVHGYNNENVCSVPCSKHASVHSCVLALPHAEAQAEVKMNSFDLYPGISALFRKGML